MKLYEYRMHDGIQVALHIKFYYQKHTTSACIMDWGMENV